MTSQGAVIVRGALQSMAGMLISMGCALGAAILFTGTLSSDDVGIFSLIIIASDLMAMAASLGLWNSLPKLISAAREKELAGKKGGLAPLIASTLIYQFLFSTALGAVVVLLWALTGRAEAISNNASWVRLFPHLWLLPLFFVAANLREVALAILAGLNRYALRAVGLIAAAASNVILVYLLVIVTDGGFMGLCVATLLSYGIGAVWLSVPLLSTLRSGAPWSAHRDAVAFSVPLYVNGFLNFLYQRVDTLFVAFLLGPSTAAYFEFGAKKLPVYGSRFLQSLIVPYLPTVSALIARGDTDGAGRLLNRASNLTLFLGYSGTLATLVVQERVITLFFPQDYLNALPALGLIMVSVCLALQAGLMGQTLIAQGRPRLVTIINAFAAVLSLAANGALIPCLGIRGAGWAAVLVMGFSDVAQSWSVSRNGIPMNAWRYLSVHFFLAASGGLLWLMPGLPGRVSALAAFVILCMLFGVLSREEIAEILSALRRR